MKTFDSSLATYLREIASVPQLTRDEECNIVAMMGEGDRIARDTLIRCHLALALKFARKQHRADPSFDLADLISEANVGLVKAADTYTPNQGYRFSTHAMFAIREAIRNHVAACADGLPIPPAGHRLLRRYRQAAQVIRQATGQKPHFGEVCDHLRLDPRRRREMASRLAAIRPISVRIGASRDESDKVVSLDIPDQSSSPASRIERDDLMARMLAVLDRLDDEDVAVIRLRFGIDQERPQSRREIAQAVKMSIPTVAAIERNILRRLSAELVISN